MLDVGKYKGKTVTTNDQNMKNRHICVIGGTGSGKTVECERLICSAVKNGETIVALDVHGTLAEDQIFPLYKETFREYVNEIDVHKNGIPCKLFSPVKYLDGSSEDLIDIVGAITDIISDAIHTGSAQNSELRKAVRFVIEEKSFDKLGFAAIDKALESAGNKTAEILRDKLYFLTAHNVLISGDEFISSNKINVFRLSKFDLKTQTVIAELILSYIWRLANAEQFKQNPIYVFIDECQNMPAGKDNALAQMLSEGRKFGINLILATQMILQGTTSAVQQRMSQCGLMLYFKPAANRVNLTAKLIDSVRDSEWARLLRTLGKGEFIADGNFLIDGKEKNGALKVSAYEPIDSQLDKRDSRGQVCV